MFAIQCIFFRGNVTDNSDSALLLVQWYPFLKPGSQEDPGAKYTMPMWIHKDASVGEWHKTLWELLLVRVVWGPGQKGQEVGGSCRFLGQRFSSKERNFHESRPLSLPRTASWATQCHEVQLKEPPLSLCLDFLFLFISKVRINLFQVTYISVIANK